MVVKVTRSPSGSIIALEAADGHGLRLVPGDSGSPVALLIGGVRSERIMIRLPNR